MNKKPVVGYEGLYEVSDCGHVHALPKKFHQRLPHATSVREGRVLAPLVHRNGHLRVWLYKDAKRTAHLVHRLVATAFIENPHNHPVVNHLDSDPSNNAVSNLEWTTFSGNNNHAVGKGRIKPPNQSGENNSAAKLTAEIVIAMRTMFRECGSSATVARHFSVSPKTTYNVVHYHRWKHIP